MLPTVYPREFSVSLLGICQDEHINEKGFHLEPRDLFQYKHCIILIEAVWQTLDLFSHIKYQGIILFFCTSVVKQQQCYILMSLNNSFLFFLADILEDLWEMTILAQTLSHLVKLQKDKLSSTLYCDAPVLLKPSSYTKSLFLKLSCLDNDNSFSPFPLDKSGKMMSDGLRTNTDFFF